MFPANRCNRILGIGLFDTRVTAVKGSCARPPSAAILAAAFAAITLGAASQASAHRSPAACTTNGSEASIALVAPAGATDLLHGDEICFQVRVFNTCTGCCDVTLLDSKLVLPNGTIVPISVDASLPFGDSFTCPGDGRCVTASTCTLPDGEVGYKYIIDHANEHGVTGVSCPPNPAGGAGEISTFLRSTAGIVHLTFHMGVNLCNAIAVAVSHACCEPCTGKCTDEFTAVECPFPNVFTPDKNCDEVTCSPCSDKLFCNGSETCVDGVCSHGPPPCDSDEWCDEGATACHLLGDADADDDVDLRDLSEFVECFAGSSDQPGYVEPTPECSRIFDFDDDKDIDWVDWVALSLVMHGPTE